MHKLIPQMYHQSRITLQQSILNGKTSEVCYYYRSVSSAVCSMYNAYLIGTLRTQSVYIYIYIYVYEDLLAFEIISESWTNPIGDIQSSFPVVGWNLSSHVPVQLIRIHILMSSAQTEPMGPIVCMLLSYANTCSQLALTGQ